MRNGDGERRGGAGTIPKGETVCVRGNSRLGVGCAEIVRQGSRHEERQTLVVNRAPRTAAATRHCIPVLGVGHVLLSSPPTRTFNCTPTRSRSSAFAASEAR